MKTKHSISKFLIIALMLLGILAFAIGFTGSKSDVNIAYADSNVAEVTIGGGAATAYTTFAEA